MDYEKKYKEALGWMREMYPCLTDSLREDAEHFFPELAESEDERIRKDIVAAVEMYGDFTQSRKEEIYAYLEKQKEQKRSLNFDVISSWLRDHARNYVNGEYNEFHHCVDYDGTIDVERLIADLKVAVDNGTFDAHEQKEQKPAEWSEEDEKFIKDLCNLLASLAKDNRVGCYYAPDLINKIKSLRPYPHWKPSEEQISALERAIVKMHTTNDIGIIAELRDNLKKL